MIDVLTGARSAGVVISQPEVTDSKVIIHSSLLYFRILNTILGV